MSHSLALHTPPPRNSHSMRGTLPPRNRGLRISDRGLRISDRGLRISGCRGSPVRTSLPAGFKVAQLKLLINRLFC